MSWPEAFAAVGIAVCIAALFSILAWCVFHDY